MKLFVKNSRKIILILILGVTAVFAPALAYDPVNNPITPPQISLPQINMDAIFNILQNGINSLKNLSGLTPQYNLGGGGGDLLNLLPTVFVQIIQFIINLLVLTLQNAINMFSQLIQ